MTTLADIMLDVAEILGGVRVGTATGGSTTTLVDTNRTEPAEYWLDGTLFLLSGTYAGVASRISAYSENTITVPATVGGAIVAGVQYAVAPPKYTFDQMQIAIQRAIDEVGEAVAVDITTLVTATTHTYALPAGVSNVLRVEVASSTTSPYSFQPTYFWEENSGYIYFVPTKAPSTVGAIIRVWYRTPHAALSLYSTVVSPNVNQEWLKWKAVVNVYRDTISQTGKDDAVIIELLNQAMAKEKELQMRRKSLHNYITSNDPKLASY